MFGSPRLGRASPARGATTPRSRGLSSAVDSNHRTLTTEGSAEDLRQAVLEFAALASELQAALAVQTRDYDELTKVLRERHNAALQETGDAGKFVAELEAEAQACRETMDSVLRRRGHVTAIGADNDWQVEAGRLEALVFREKHRNRESASLVRDLQEKNKTKQQADQRRQSTRKEKDRQDKACPLLDRKLKNCILGLQVAKVEASTIARKEPARQMRRLRIEFRSGGPVLAWAKPSNLYSFQSFVDLRQVMSLGYGFASRSPWLFGDEDKRGEAVPPSTPSSWGANWSREGKEESRRRKEASMRVDATRCFSVYLAERSYDFVCENELDAEAFMICLTRLCSMVQGWPVLGGIKTPCKFVCARGWVKVQRAIRNRIAQGHHPTSFRSVLVKACRQAAARAEEPGRGTYRGAEARAAARSRRGVRNSPDGAHAFLD